MKVIPASELTPQFYHYSQGEDVSETVKQILVEVRDRGDEAVREYTAKFDSVELDHLRVHGHAIEDATEEVDISTLANIEFAALNIRAFAEAQLQQFQDFEIEVQEGVYCGQRVIPIDRVGVYVPGGRFPLPSTLLMGAIPAGVAGVAEVVVCSPPSFNGGIHPAILAAAHLAGVNEVYAIGGVQAIGAMAFGTDTVRAVDKIVGPGNQYVAEAKRQVFGVVGIDMIAGPTEVLVLADETADPELIASDFIGQAEHDPGAVPTIVTPSADLADLTRDAIERQLVDLPTISTAGPAIENNGLIILAHDLDQAIDIANRKAPEHLLLAVDDLEGTASRLKHYGTLFIGSNAAVAFGDYSAGVNHTLPTNRSARYSDGLSVKHFLKVSTTLQVTEPGLLRMGPVAENLAETEGLIGHARSVTMRNPAGKGQSYTNSGY